MPTHKTLVISVHLDGGRYHGESEWPPSPARLFQALVAGAAHGTTFADEVISALQWLEDLASPRIAAPKMEEGQPLTLFVPNNDLDAVGCDPRRVGEIRSAKHTLPRIFDPSIPLLYAWRFDETEEQLQKALMICTLAEQLYQLGRGIDMAWATGDVCDEDALEAPLREYKGRIYHPTLGGSGLVLSCPQSGSLASLQARHAANATRFQLEGPGKAARQLFSQPPKARFQEVAYNSPPSQQLFEIRETTADAAFAVWPLDRASQLVTLLRNGAVERLKEALPHRASEIEAFLVGRKANGADAGPPERRVHIVPLPSIGHLHADRGIRRVLVEVPALCPLSPGDVFWAFSSLELVNQETGVILEQVLTPTDDRSMLRHFGVGEKERAYLWRSVTPVVLPSGAGRRRSAPSKMLNGSERLLEEERAAAAVIQALRFCGNLSRAMVVRVQREPFETHGERVEAFALGTRFSEDRLWHVEIRFESAQLGPLVVGDGRFLGLGVMAPAREPAPAHV